MLTKLEEPENTLPPALMLMCPTKEKLNKEKVSLLLSLAKIYIFQKPKSKSSVFKSHQSFFKKNYWIREKMRLNKTEIDKSLKLYLGNTMLEELFIDNVIVQKNNGMLCDRWNL